MIKINKSKNPPNILKKNKEKWTNNLVAAVNKYGKYSEIPKKEREKLLKFYRSKEIQKALSISSLGKCAFCECIPSESGNLEVEHFAPKSIYYELAFDWDNFLPVCRNCNAAKLAHDTKKEPIVNPSKENPEVFFDFNYISMIPSTNSPDKQKSERTIEVCDLNATRLVKARADLLVGLTNYINVLKEWINQFEEVDTTIKKGHRIVNLRNSIEMIENLATKKEKYSLYSKFFLEKSKTYKKAKDIIENYDTLQCSNL